MNTENRNWVEDENENESEGVLKVLVEQQVERKLLQKLLEEFPLQLKSGSDSRSQVRGPQREKNAKRYPLAFSSLTFQLITQNPPSVTLEGGICEQMEKPEGYLLPMS